MGEVSQGPRTMKALRARCTDWLQVCPKNVRQADVAKAGQSSSADNKLSSSSAISCSPEIPQVCSEVPDRPLQRILIPLGIEGIGKEVPR